MIIFKKIKDTTNQFDITDLEMTINNNDINLPDLLYEFKLFLIACGYSPRNVELINYEGDSDE